MLASRTHWRLLIGTILALIAAAWFGPNWVRAPDIQENRVLAPKPAWPHRLQDLKGFREGADAYVIDHFPARPHLIGVLNRLRMLAGVSGSKRVIVGRDGWLFFDDDSHLGAARGIPPLQGPEVRRWLMNLAGRTEYAQARGAHYLVVTPPAKETVYPQFGPAWYRGPNPDRATVVLPRIAQETGAGEVLYLYPAVAAATKTGEKTFSRHDTHWTSYGAYAGYVALMQRLRALGLTTDEPRPLSAFHRVAHQAKGGPRDLALMLGVSSFVHLDYPHFDNPAAEARLRTTYLTPKTDWTAPQVIDTGQAGKPVLMLTRDSFSNEVLPFLYPHFSRIILSHVQDGFWRPDLIERFKPDIVVLEVIEAGLRPALNAGPPPDAAAAARIDRVLAHTRLGAPPAAAGGNLLPSLTAPDAAIAAILATAAPTGNCNIEVASLGPGEGGAATLTASGWLSELGARVTSPDGLIALKGPARVVAATVKMDKPRPDVAAYFKSPAALRSGFVGTFFIARLPRGAYTPFIYRRAGVGWIGCAGKTALAAP
jgi:hypothetical protein